MLFCQLTFDRFLKHHFNKLLRKMKFEKNTFTEIFVADADVVVDAVVGVAVAVDGPTVGQ